MVRDFVTKKRVEKGLMPETLAVDELPADEENLAEDEEVRQKILNLIEGDAPSLLPIEGEIKFSKWFRFMGLFCSYENLIGNFGLSKTSLSLYFNHFYFYYLILLRLQKVNSRKKLILLFLTRFIAFFVYVSTVLLFFPLYIYHLLCLDEARIVNFANAKIIL